jgi:hypothetical protein
LPGHNIGLWEVLRWPYSADQPNVAAFVGFLTAGPPLVGLLLLAFYCLVYLLRSGWDQRIDRLIGGVALLIPGVMIAHAVNRLINLLRPYKLDRYVFRLDGLFGFEPGFVVGRLVKSLPWFAQVFLAISYSLMPIAIVVLYWAYSCQFPDESRLLLRILLLNLSLCVPVYLLVPVAGPFYAFPSFPDLPPKNALHPLLLDALPNGIPSVHFSTALLCAWYARRLPWGRGLGGFYLIATILATLGFGEHYLLDLLVAVPYLLGVLRLEKLLPTGKARPRRVTVTETKPLGAASSRENRTMLNSVPV